MKEYLKDKINEIPRNSKNMNIRNLCRRINEFKMSYQTINNLVKDENGDLHADSHTILSKWKNYFPQLLNVHNVSDDRQMEVYTAEPLMPSPTGLEAEIAIVKLQSINCQEVIKFRQN
jgi:hypothetical protein